MRGLGIGNVAIFLVAIVLTLHSPAFRAVVSFLFIYLAVSALFVLLQRARRDARPPVVGRAMHSARKGETLFIALSPESQDLRPSERAVRARYARTDEMRSFDGVGLSDDDLVPPHPDPYAYNVRAFGSTIPWPTSHSSDPDCPCSYCTERELLHELGEAGFSDVDDSLPAGDPTDPRISGR